MMSQREKQLAYSDIQPEMSRAESRVRKAAKICAVLDHFMGPDWAGGAVFLDIGASLGWTVEAAARRGATAIGMDIDEPGLAVAKADRDPRCIFASGDGENLPFPDDSVDVVVLNHIYEHVVDADAVVAEIHRVLSPTGVAYFGLGNRLGIMEPHHHLPFLSWLPYPMADRYVRALRDGDGYYERFRTRSGLEKMTRAFYVTDYTFSVLADPEMFSATDVSPGLIAKAVRRAPLVARRALQTLIPTFLWVATKTPRTPAGPALSIPPTLVHLVGKA